MKRTILLASIAIVSFILGVFFMGYLSSTASITFLDIVKVNYINEQEILAIRAKKDGNINKAIYYYSNMVAAKESPGLRSFDINKNPWNLFFPFEAIELRKLSNTPRQRGIEIDIGFSHGKLANALEMAGLHKEAEEEYKKASILIRTSPEKVKKLIDDLRNYEDEMLKLEDVLLNSKKYEQK